MAGRSNAHPSVAAAGAFVAIAWGATADAKTDVYLATSSDSGATFSAPARVNRAPGEARLGGEMPPRVALLPTSASSPPEIVVLWTSRGEHTEVKTSRSSDGGRTFHPPTSLESAGAAGDRGWPALALDRAGTAHAVWLDHRGLAVRRATGASHAAHHDAAHDGVAMAQNSGLYYAAANQGGVVERELTKGVCYCCKTALTAGPDGAIYVAWRHVYPGNLRDIAFAFTRDGGRSFSVPTRVSEDGWAINGCPDDGPAMAADAHGVVHVVWPTVIGGAEPQGAIFYASTRDGRRFTPRVRVPTVGGPKPSHPQLVIDTKGRVVVAWDESVDGQRRAFMRDVGRAPDGAATFGAITSLSADEPSMYPALAATDAGVVAVWTTGGSWPRVRARSIAF